jgi:predicted TPR repeat methyltransferase
MMKENDIIRAHDEEAFEYDRQAREYKWFGHDILFGMSFEYVNPNERLIDLGIGTGLGSELFAKAGLEIFGLDGSTKMLKVCESKGFVKELKHFDLRNLPLPYSDGFFNHVVCCGVFHFFGELKPIFIESSRVIKPGGIFAFTVQTQTSEGYSEKRVNGIPVFMHSDRYVEKVLQDVSFDRLKELKFLVRSVNKEHEDAVFQAYVAQKRS